MLYAGIFVYTLGEVVAVLGTNPYASRRVPASHWGRIGGIGNVLYSVFQTLNQYLISFVLMAAEEQYHLLWLIFMGIGLVGIVLYTPWSTPWTGAASPSSTSRELFER